MDETYCTDEVAASSKKGYFNIATTLARTSRYTSQVSGSRNCSGSSTRRKLISGYQPHRPWSQFPRYWWLGGACASDRVIVLGDASALSSPEKFQRTMIEGGEVPGYRGRDHKRSQLHTEAKSPVLLSAIKAT